MGFGVHRPPAKRGNRSVQAQGELDAGKIESGQLCTVEPVVPAILKARRS